MSFRVALLARQRRFTARELSLCSRVPLDVVSDLMGAQGSPDVDLRQLADIATALEVDVSELIRSDERLVVEMGLRPRQA